MPRRPALQQTGDRESQSHQALYTSGFSIPRRPHRHLSGGQDSQEQRRPIHNRRRSALPALCWRRSRLPNLHARGQCLKDQSSRRGRQVTRFEPKATDPSNPSERMRRAIDSVRGRRLYSQRIGTVEPVFGNLRHNKRLTRLNLRGSEKVNAQWHLYCMVHNIEKIANSGWAP